MREATDKKQLDAILSEGKKFLALFWKHGCLGCMAVSKLAEMLEGGAWEIVSVNCDEATGEEAKSAEKYFGGSGTPYWALFDGGEKIAAIVPTESRDALYKFLGEAGIHIPRPIFELALDEGRKYADYQQDCIAELMFRNGDEEGILRAARLKIVKACIESGSEAELRECLAAQVAACIRRLEEKIAASGGETADRRNALKRFPAMQEELLAEIRRIYRKDGR